MKKTVKFLSLCLQHISSSLSLQRINRQSTNRQGPKSKQGAIFIRPWGNQRRNGSETQAIEMTTNECTDILLGAFLESVIYVMVEHNGQGIQNSEQPRIKVLGTDSPSHFDGAALSSRGKQLIFFLQRNPCFSYYRTDANKMLADVPFVVQGTYIGDHLY